MFVCPAIIRNSLFSVELKSVLMCHLGSVKLNACKIAGIDLNIFWGQQNVVPPLWQTQLVFERRSRYSSPRLKVNLGAIISSINHCSAYFRFYNSLSLQFRIPLRKLLQISMQFNMRYTLQFFHSKRLNICMYKSTISITPTAWPLFTYILYVCEAFMLKLLLF